MKRQRSRVGLIVIVVVVIAVVAVAAIGYQQHWFHASSSGSGTGCASGVTLQGNGAQIVIPLMSYWISDYASATGNHVSYPGAGSGTGITDFTGPPPTIDFAVTDNPLSSAQRAALPSPALTLPIVGGAITVIYNLPGLTGHLNLTGALLADIYNGSITQWNDSAIQAINPGVPLPGHVITTIHRFDSAGTTYVITDLMSQDSPSWAATVGKGLLVSWPTAPTQTAVKGNSLMLSTVATTAYSIGYSDLTDTLTYATPLQYAAVKNPAGAFIVPDLANTASAINDKIASMSSLPASTASWYNVSMVNANGTVDYPVATLIYLYIYQNGSKAFLPSLDRTQVVVQWVDYILSPAAQAIADQTSPEPLYYVPLPSAVLTVDQAGLQTMNYNGASLPACT